MQKDYKNKQITNEQSEQKSPQELQDFHFSGGGEYAPLTISAESYEEALKIWEGKKIKVKP